MIELLEPGRAGQPFRTGPGCEMVDRRPGPQNNPMSVSRISFAEFAVGFLIVGAVWMLLLVTPYGVGLSPDSLTYLGAARNIESGRGFTMPPTDEPVAHLAPGYSLVLAAVGALGSGPLVAARWLSAALFGLNIFLIYQLGKNSLGEGWPAGGLIVAVAALALLARPLWEIHLMAWTEPLFIAFCLAALWALGSSLQTPGRLQLALAGVFLAGAILTRYAGLSVWAACLAGLVLIHRGSVRRRLLDASILSAISLLPFALWSARNLWEAGTATNRTIRFHPITWDRAHEGLSTVASWMLVPVQASGWVKLGVIGSFAAILLGGAAWWLTARRDPGRPSPVGGPVPPVVGLAGLCVLVYPLFLITSLSLVDANTPLDQRILSPLFIFALFPAIFGLGAWQRILANRRFARLLPVACVAVFALSHGAWSYSLAAKSAREGIGFNGLRWRDAGLIQVLREIPAGQPVYSNSPDAVFFLTGREAKRLPTAFHAMTQAANPHYRAEMSRVGQELAAGGGLVYLDLGGASARLRVETLVRELHLVPRWNFAAGTLYTH